MKPLYTTLIIATSIIFIASMIRLHEPTQVRIDGHLYQLLYDHSGRCAKVHVDSCGCWSKLNDKPN